MSEQMATKWITLLIIVDILLGFNSQEKTFRIKIYLCIYNIHSLGGQCVF